MDNYLLVWIPRIPSCLLKGMRKWLAYLHMPFTCHQSEWRKSEHILQMILVSTSHMSHEQIPALLSMSHPGCLIGIRGLLWSLYITGKEIIHYTTSYVLIAHIVSSRPSSCSKHVEKWWCHPTCSLPLGSGWYRVTRVRTNWSQVRQSLWSRGIRVGNFHDEAGINDRPIWPMSLPSRELRKFHLWTRQNHRLKKYLWDPLGGDMLVPKRSIKASSSIVFTLMFTKKKLKTDLSSLFFEKRYQHLC